MKPLSARSGPTTSAFAVLTPALVACLIVLVTSLALAPLARAASGDLAWQRDVTGPNNEAAFTALSAAPRGGVFASGWVTDATGDFLATRYSPAGVRSWLRSLDFTLHAYDSVHAAASDRFGNLIVAGQVDYMSLSQAEAIVKYRPGGGRAWTRYIKDSLAGQQTQVVADTGGNVFVVTTVSTGGVALVKYSSSGVRRWTRTYVGSGDTQARAIGVDGAGDVYLAGFSFTTTSQYDILVIKYDTKGRRDWVRVWKGTANGDDEAWGLTVTTKGAAYVAGSTTTASTGQDAVVVKYRANGSRAWVHSYSSQGAFDDEFTSIAQLANGDLAATGYQSPGAQQDVIVVRLSAGGATRWRTSYDGPDQLADVGSFVSGGKGGVVYVAGQSDGAATGTDMLTLKYGAGGGFKWAKRNNGPGTDSFDYPHGLVVTGGGVYVVGIESTNTTDTATLLKYAP